MRRSGMGPWAALAALLLAGTLPSHGQSAAELERYGQRLLRLFQRLDQNGDQRLERREVEGHPYLERHFSRLDRQQRGYLRPDDLQTPLAHDGDRGRALFQAVDRNGDGRLDRLETEPFPWLQRRFSDADRNADGQLSREELRTWREQRRPR